MAYQKTYLSLAIPLLLCGCHVGPDFHAPKPPDITQYTTKATQLPKDQALHPGQNVPNQWWQAFECSALNRLIEEGLRSSPTIKSAKAALLQAQEQYRAQRGSLLFPSLNGSASAIRQQVNLQSIGITSIAGVPVSNPPPFTLYNIGANVAYQFDFSGGNRRQLEALQAQVDYQRFEFMAAQTTLAANIVTSVIQGTSLQDQINITEQIITLHKERLAILQQRLQAGGVSELEVLNQQSALTQTQASLAPLQKKLAQLENQLAIYLAKNPDKTYLPNISLADLHLPSNLPLSLPAQLIAQRPDILGAQALYHQASANVGVATANLIPNINITGSLATEYSAIKNLFGPGSGAWNIGPRLTQPLFQGGALWAKRRAAYAALEQAKAAYEETVLMGIKNVADSLLALEYDAKTAQARMNDTQAARQIYDISLQQYEAGGMSYIDLLSAQQQWQQNQIVENQAHADRYSDTVGLFVALGGGWDT